MKRARQQDVSSELKKAFKFVLLFLALSLPAYLVLERLSLLNYIAAYSSAWLLQNLFSLPTIVVEGYSHPFLSLQGFMVEIIDLCSGKIEIALMFGFLFASFEKSLSYRIKGFLVGLFLLLVFNAVRIAFTVQSFASNSLGVSAFFHDVLFRVSLVLFLVTYYALWYYYDLPRKTTLLATSSPRKRRKR